MPPLGDSPCAEGHEMDDEGSKEGEKEEVKGKEGSGGRECEGRRKAWRDGRGRGEN